MSLLTTVSHRDARLAIVAHAVTVVLAAAVAVSAVGGWSGPSSALTVAVSGIAVAVSGSCLVIASLLGRLLAWDRRLAALDANSLDPLTLESASGSSAADRGWNGLVEQGRRWQTLAELEQTLVNKLSGHGGGDASRVLDAISDGVAAIDSSGVITRANSVMAGICGGDSPQELIGQSLAEALRVDEPTALRLHGASTHSQFVAEWNVPGGGGSSRTLRGTRRLLPGGEAEPPAHVWTIRDVTQQRLAEAMREKFLSAATHEFRTPLANIRAYAESLDLGHDIDAEARKRFYNVIQSESLRLSQLVDDLLDISRMQAGALALDSRETDLGRLVEEAAAKVQAQMRDKHLQFRCELPPKFPRINVDKSKLTAALVNLLGNAAKYTPSGGKVTFRVDIGSQKAQFSVTDTGIGIAPDELPRVFERFFRSSDERVREITGSGLGLALAQEIARLHGGELIVESKLNEGSTFRLSIPMDSAD